jgi:RNA 3'-terminal phosphate cyclase (ATP)
MLTIDGSYGEGGGQILRSTLTLSAMTQKPVRLVNIRAGRSKPGLRPQHLTAVRAAAAICDATLQGDYLDSQTLTFTPRAAPRAGAYTFDVADAARGGSAGSVMLIVQTVLLPLALASGDSQLRLKGGTHVPWSPSALYVQHVYLPTLAKLGVTATLDVLRWGFYPRGGGEVTVSIMGDTSLNPWCCTARGALEAVEGIAYAANLPSHIPQRMSDRARSLLKTECDSPDAEVSVHITPRHVPSPGPGAGLFLLARYEHIVAGFTALGRRGLPSEEVAEMAVEELVAHHRGGGVDAHLGDQLVLPLVLSGGPACVAISEVTRHLLTNVWVALQFELAPVQVQGEEGQPGFLIIGDCEHEI